MCLAIPAQIKKLSDDRLAIADYHGNEIKVEMGLVEAGVGDYVLIHAGCAIERIDPNMAQEIFDLLAEMGG